MYSLFSAATLWPFPATFVRVWKATQGEPRAACRRLHVALCAGQSAFWHAFPQYRTVLHALHSFSLPSSDLSAVIPQCAHVRLAYRVGLARARETPPGDVGSGAPENCPWPGMWGSPRAMAPAWPAYNRAPKILCQGMINIAGLPRPPWNVGYGPGPSKALCIVGSPQRQRVLDHIRMIHPTQQIMYVYGCW
jgi:hypothetical protein